MPLGPAHPLAALLLEHADLRSPRFAVDDGDDLGVGDEGRAGEDFSAVFFDEQHVFDGQLGAGLAGSSADEREAARGYLELLAAGRDDCVHNRHLRKTYSVPTKALTRKELGLVRKQ